MNQIDTRRFYLTGVFLLFFLVSLAQENQKYSGSLQLGSYTGKANYNYKIFEQDTILDGPFQLQRSSLEALLEKEDASFLFKGHFSDGKAEGQWKFEFGEFQSDSHSEVVDFEYRVLISGNQESGSGTLTNGRPDGKWVYVVNQIKDSEIEKTLFKSDFTYIDGIPQQNFKIENEKTVLVGRFLRNGLAQDEWSSYAVDAIDDSESWFFEDGLLRAIQIVNDQESKRTSVFDTGEDYKIIQLDQRYQKLVQITLQSNNDAFDLHEGISSLLIQNEKYYHKIDTVLTQLGSKNFIPDLKVKVPHHPLDSIQFAQLNAVQTDFETASSISDRLLKNSHLNIVRRSDADALFHYKAAELISEQFLKPVENFLQYKKQGIIEFMDVSKSIQGLWPNGKPSIPLNIILDSVQTARTFSVPNGTDFDFGGNDLKSLVQITRYAKSAMKQILENVSYQLTNEERLQTLNELEEDLIVLNNALVQQIDSSIATLPENYGKAVLQIKTVADASLSAYASMKNPEEKLKYGTDLKTCFEHLRVLVSQIIALPAKTEEIQAHYLDSVWNPFMATVMDEEIKKRITNAYTQILVPYFLKQTTTNLKCDSAKKLVDQIKHTNALMMVLRDEDTRKLERKLRKEKNPQKILELLHQQGTVKESKHE